VQLVEVQADKHNVVRHRKFLTGGQAATPFNNHEIKYHQLTTDLQHVRLATELFNPAQLAQHATTQIHGLIVGAATQFHITAAQQLVQLAAKP
jgi:hypothetical protein